MLEYMRFRCRKCGVWIDCGEDEFERHEECCENCFFDETE